MSTTADYRGRTADLVAFRAIFKYGSVGRQPLMQELVRSDNGGELVTGIQKLLQRVLLVLLTRMGSKPLAPLDGTTFLADAAKGRWRTPGDVSASFYTAKLDVSRQVRAVELDTDPADERWGGLELDGVTLTGDSAAVRISLTSAAGTSYVFVTPIAVPLR